MTLLSLRCSHLSHHQPRPGYHVQAARVKSSSEATGPRASCSTAILQISLLAITCLYNKCVVGIWPHLCIPFGYFSATWAEWSGSSTPHGPQRWYYLVSGPLEKFVDLA